MPTYIYECNECEHSFEQLQKMSDEPLKKCPECGKNELFKVITGGIYACVKNTNHNYQYKRTRGERSGGGSSRIEERVAVVCWRRARV